MPNVVRFVSNASGDLDIKAYDQPTLALDVSGSADVTAEGRTDALRLEIDGSGDADLRALAARDATVDISGSGDANVAPTGDVQVRIDGSGDVTLAARPAKLTTELSGSGDVYQD